MDKLDKSKRKEIVLIGPMATGKSTISLLISNKLNISCFPIDDIKWYFVYKNGYNTSTSKQILISEGFQGKMNYFYNYFGIKEIEQIFTDFHGGVFDFGATHIYHNEYVIFCKIRNILSQFQNIFLILPTNDLSVNIKILNQRIIERYDKSKKDSQIVKSYMDYNKFLLENNIFNLITSKIIYTESKNQEQIVCEILERKE